MIEKTYGPAKLTIEQMYSNRQDADAAGHSHFFTGKPCKNNHIAHRAVKHGRCMEWLRIRSKKAYAKLKNSPNWELLKEERRIKKQQFYKENKERIDRENKAWRTSNKDKMDKYYKNYYDDNLKEIRARKRKYYEDNQEKLIKYQRDYRKSVKEEKNMIEDGDFL